VSHGAEDVACPVSAMTSRSLRRDLNRAWSEFSTRFHKESRASTVSAQTGPGLCLMRTRVREHSADIERDVLRALPEHYGRAGGAQRFSRVNGWEGSSKSALRRVTGCPGVAASSTESSTHGRTGRRPPWCCRSTCEVRFASGDLPSASKTALLGARERWTPPCLVRGQGSQNELRN